MIKIKNIIMKSELPEFVEYFSTVDSRSHIQTAQSFIDQFGFSESELIHFSYTHKRKNKMNINDRIVVYIDI